jgi:hypothetical protein
MKESTGSGAPGFPGMPPVPARNRPKPTSPQSFALTASAVENPQATTCSDDRPLTHIERQVFIKLDGPESGGARPPCKTTEGHGH